MYRFTSGSCVLDELSNWSSLANYVPQEARRPAGHVPYVCSSDSFRWVIISVCLPYKWNYLIAPVCNTGIDTGPDPHKQRAELGGSSRKEFWQQITFKIIVSACTGTSLILIT
jgi:hypothetical protein